ncbi:MAG TPA: DUF3014 domain-containing protein [Casimicrobiaceae bacterium]|nr:DUF3014 domain-containing protein [Casimicrobiaceae bacterium]
MAKPELEISTDDRPLFRPGKPPVRWGFPLLLGAVIAAAGVLYYFWQLRAEPPRPAPAPTAAAPAVAPQPSAEPRIEHPIEVAAAPPAPPLPALAESDPSLQEALAGLFGGTAFDLLFRPQDIVRHFVAAIDNLPRKTVAQRIMPIKPVTGAFRANGPEGRTIVGADNAARYAPYVRALEAVDSAKLVALYVRLYPLFQQAYAELGYPSRYFNDRVFEVIDHLLATPDVRGPIALVQPKVMHEYADPALQDLSAGQKMLVRMGQENETKVKAKLRELKKALSRGL